MATQLGFAGSFVGWRGKGSALSKPKRGRGAAAWTAKHDGEETDSLVVPRRRILEALAAAVSGWNASGLSPASAERFQVNKVLESRERKDRVDPFMQTSFVYTVLPPNQLREADPAAALNLLSSGNSVSLVGHPESLADHFVMASMIRSFHSKGKKVILGMEQIQQQFQPVLDSYLRGDIDEEALYESCEWKSRWPFPFDNYLPLFWTCRELGCQILALSPPTELVERVRVLGYEGLTKQERNEIVIDWNTFQDLPNHTDFVRYEENVSNHSTVSFLGRPSVRPETFEFQAVPTLLDEAMATILARQVMSNPDVITVNCVNIDRARYGFGIPGRLKSLLDAQSSPNKYSTKSLMINPTTADTGKDASTGDMLLQLDVSDANSRVSDLLWYSNNVPSAIRKGANSWKKTKSQFF